MVPLRSLGINESGVAESLRAGVDLITYSGDKMLGGPQAGMLSGREELIRRIRANAMFRALRVDKLTYAALEATLMEYLRQNHQAIPFLRMMRASAEEVHTRAQSLQVKIAPARNLRTEIIAGESLVGGGSAPTSTLASFLLAITAEALSANDLAERLRMNKPPIITRVEEGRVLVDLRTVFPEEEAELARALIEIGS